MVLGVTLLCVCIIQECHLSFDGSGFYELNGAMYCERHFLAHRGMICASCGQPISGRCVTAMYKKYHPHHFVCTFCLQPLNRGTFKEQSEKPYCHACFEKLFGWTLMTGCTFTAKTAFFFVSSIFYMYVLDLTSLFTRITIELVCLLWILVVSVLLSFIHLCAMFKRVR